MMFVKLARLVFIYTYPNVYNKYKKQNKKNNIFKKIIMN